MIEVNKYQTPITDELKAKYPEEVWEQFEDMIATVPFIQNLISPNRPNIEDLPRDENGRAIIDLANPPIIKDTDYFMKASIFFTEHKCYTFLKPNSNPNSEYQKHWREEIKRCYNGLLRESDGMYIPGYLYWFLNYCPMMINKYKEGHKKAIRTEGFPYFFEGIWWRYLYLQKARNEGHHAVELAKRGAGKAHPYDEFVYTPQGKKQWKDIKIGDFVYGDDGNITKVIDVPFDGIAPIYEIELSNGYKVKCSEGHLWKVYSHCKGEMVVSTKELLSIYKRPRKVSYHNPNGIELDCTIPIGRGIDFQYIKTEIDPYTFGLLLGDRCFRFPDSKDTAYFTACNEDFEIYKNIIPYNYVKYNSKYSYGIRITNIKETLKHYGLYFKKSEDKFIPDEYKYNSRAVRIAILRGLLDADGTIDKGKIELVLSSKKMIDDVQWICSSLGIATSNIRVKKAWYYNKDRVKVPCLNAYRLSIFSNINLFNLPRKTELWNNRSKTNYGKSKYGGHKIVNIKYLGEQKSKCIMVDNESHCYLINNFIVTHNSFGLSAIMTHNLILGESYESNKRCITVLTAYQKEYLKDDKDGTLSKFVPTLSFLAKNTPFPKLMLKQSSNDMTWQMGYKDEYGRSQGSLNQVIGVSAKDDSDKLRGKRGVILFEEFGNFPSLLELYDVTRKSVEDGDYTFALMYLLGTSNNKEANFQSAKTLLYAPESYNILPIRNVYDKKGQGRDTFGFFFPSYINRAGCYNKDGVSDVVKALLQVLLNRYKAKYGADPTSVLRVIAEDPITPAEAIIKVKDAYFNVQALNERARELDTNPRLYDDIYVGELIYDKENNVKFVPTSDMPIRSFPVDNTTPGALEIYAMPEKDANNKVFNDRYIIGADPYDNDQAESSSLYSIIVFDLFTDNIVAEYTGRTSYANDAHEIALKLCLFYNTKIMFESNKKGWFAYFQTKQKQYLLAETPEYLREKNLIKYKGFGSSAYGINASAGINNYANSLIKDWFNKLVPVVTHNDNGTETMTEVPIIYTLKGRALIEEAIQFRPELNVDRIRALGMVMLYRQQYIIQYGGSLDAVPRDNSNIKAVEDDDFFNRNYHSYKDKYM